jgi:hypothetical protein
MEHVSFTRAFHPQNTPSQTLLRSKLPEQLNLQNMFHVQSQVAPDNQNLDFGVREADEL